MSDQIPPKDPSGLSRERALANEPSWTGRTLSHYRICELIGAGGMGVVYRAVDTRLNRSLAMKILPASKTGDPDRRRRFIQEARAASALNHPNIVTIYEIGSEEEIDFIAMEYISGHTLESCIYRGDGLTISETLKYAVQMADALSAAHAAGIIHRDLKPANVMITDKGLVKILDFGLAKLSMQFGDPDVTRTVGPVTVHGAVIGTISYMSPEQAEGKAIDARSDIFSFGAVLYEMIARKRPFIGDTPLSTLSAILVKDPVPVVEMVPGASMELEELILRCLRKSPGDRVQQMDELKLELEKLLLPPALSGITQRFKYPTQRKFPWKPVAAVAGVLGLLLLGALLWQWRTKSVPSATQSMLTRLTSENGMAAYPAISPDGKLLAYATDRANEGGLDIWVQQIGGGDPIRLTRDEADEYEPQFSPDGTQIVFRSEKDGGGIYVIPALGGSARLVNKEGHRPRFSPSAKYIAYWTGFPSPNFHPGVAKVFVVPVTGGAPRQVAADMAAARSPVWMPDGEHVLVIGRLDTRESLDWYVVPVNGGKPQRTGAFAAFAAKGFLPPPVENVIVPEMTVPDSDEVLFSATLGDATNVWQIRLDPVTGKVSGSPEQLTSGTGLESQASAGSARVSAPVAFAALTLNVDVFLLPLDERGKPGELRPVTNALSFDAYPSISADGGKVVYVSSKTEHGILKLRDVASGNETILTTPLKGEIMPKLSPDGTRVAYADEKSATGYVIKVDGGIPEKICDRCILANGWSNDGRRVIFDGGTNFEPLALVDIPTLKRVDYLFATSHKDYLMNAGHFSPDDRWVSFHVRVSPLARQIFVAKVNGDTPPPEAEWIPITDGKAMDREAAWSPSGSSLFFISDRDGFRCIWEQRLDPATKVPRGPAAAVQHMHHARRSLTAVGPNTGALGFSSYRGGLAFAMGELTGNIWLRHGVTR